MVPRGESGIGGKRVLNDYWLSAVIYEGRIRWIRTARPLDDWNDMGKHSEPESICPTCKLPNGNHDIRKHRLALDPESEARREAMRSGRHPAGKGRHAKG